MSETEGTTRLSRIRQIAVTVSDVAKSLEFYGDVLRLEFLFSAGSNLAFLDAGGVRLMLTAPEGGGEPGKASVLYFSVADAVSAHRELVARGATSERGPELVARMSDHELWIAFLRDPDGNLVGLLEERR